MSDRFGRGFEKYGEYETIKEFIFYTPHFAEVLIAIGSFGVILAFYSIFDEVFSVSRVEKH